jgi:hypothetical protein
MTRCGLVVEDLIKVQVPPGGTNSDFPEFPSEWVQRWPADEVWFARRRSARTGGQRTSRTGRRSGLRQIGVAAAGSFTFPTRARLPVRVPVPGS